MDLIASSAVNLPMTRASLRSLVVWIGVRSIRRTYSEKRVPLRFTLTMNFLVFIFSCPSQVMAISKQNWPKLLTVHLRLQRVAKLHTDKGDPVRACMSNPAQICGHLTVIVSLVRF